MFKYEVGEKVRIKRDLKVGDGNGTAKVVPSMLKYKNELAIITVRRTNSSGANIYELDIDDGTYGWEESVLVIPRGLDSATQSTQSVTLDTSDLLRELQNITSSINNMKKETSPIEQAITEGVIEKAKDLAIKDLEEQIKNNLGDFIKKTYGLLPKQVIEIRKGDTRRETKGVFHKQFEDILSMVECGVNPLICGGAGSGKTYLCEQVAEAMDYNFFFTGAIMQEHKLFGYKDANGDYHATQFYKWCTTPKSVFYFDEFDASDANVVLSINTALANGYVDFPNEGRVNIPKENRFIASANTLGQGADSLYVGRNQLDAATRDRFAVVEFEYDENIEKALAYDNSLYEFIYQLRKAISKNGLNDLVTMRATKDTTKLLENTNIPKSRLLNYTILKGMSKDSINTLVRDSIFDTSNEWYKEFRQLSDF